MRNFTIYAPLEEFLPHYFTVTLIGFRRGLIVRWTPGPDGWRPKVMRLNDVPAFDGSALHGYERVGPTYVEPEALRAMMGT